MSIVISYTDQETAINVYGLLMNSSNQFYKPATGTFVSFGSLSDHVFYLSEGSARTYSNTLSINPSSGDYTLKLYKRTGASPNLANDLLRNVRGFYYDQDEQVEISEEEIWLALVSLVDSASSTLASLSSISATLDAIESSGESNAEQLATIRTEVESIDTWVKNIASKVRAK
jgi:hypothetical protein